MKRQFFRLVLTALTIFFTLFAGCCANTQSARFYALSSVPNATINNPLDKNGNDIAIGIGPIKIPDYLDRPQIITRNNQNEIAMSEFELWSGKLKDAIANVLSENLANILSTDRTVLYPWRGSIPLDYQVEVEIIQFDGEPAGNVTLVAHWIVSKEKTKKVLAMKRTCITETVSGNTYTAFVAAQSRSLLNLSQDIAAEINKISIKQP